MDFEWDDQKDKANQEKHGIAFSDAIGTFADPDLIILDATHKEDDEIRMKAIGSVDGKLFVVVFTERGSSTRIISARRANRKEERIYGDSQSHA